MGSFRLPSVVNGPREFVSSGVGGAVVTDGLIDSLLTFVTVILLLAVLIGLFGIINTLALRDVGRPGPAAPRAAHR